MPPPHLTGRIKTVQGVRLHDNYCRCEDIHIGYPSEHPEGIVTTETLNDSLLTDVARAPLVLPPLTHPHIHLDKAFIHSATQYAHLRPQLGSFAEALSSTTRAKERFIYSDVLRRGEWLLAESVSSGVTAMRAFVEVDHMVKLKNLDAAVALKEAWKECCEIQIVCFAQEPLFSGEHAETNMCMIEDALRQYPQIEVIGATPYVESSAEAAKENIEWAIDRAWQLEKHVDFHLDYNLDPNEEPLVWHVLETLRNRGWTIDSTPRRVMLGHCTRLTLFTDEEWARLAGEIHEYNLPVSFVGLPTSDIYMASASDPCYGSSQYAPHNRPRGTLQVLNMIDEHNLDAVIGVNNVGNAFTPWGSPDPLSLACLGVGIYQAGSEADAELLYQCVSTRARAAIGLPSSNSSTIGQGDRPDFLLFLTRDDTGCGVSRPRSSLAEIVWDPPARSNRDVVIGGRLKPSLSSSVHAETMYRLYQFLQ